MSDLETTSLTLEALRADRDALVAVASELNPRQWRAPSGCPGWTTKDLFSHLSSTFWSLLDASAGPDTAGLGFEAAAAVQVEARRSMTPVEVLADYTDVSLRALEVLPAVAALEVDLPLGPTESYPASLVPAAFCFDHYTHLRADLFAPRGSLTGPLPPSDDLRLTPTLEWIDAAIPQQNPALVTSLPGRIDLIVTGPGARTIRVGTGGPVATIESDALSLVRWITQRGRWDELDVKAEGPADTLDIARLLKVY